MAAETSLEIKNLQIEELEPEKDQQLELEELEDVEQQPEADLKSETEEYVAEEEQRESIEAKKKRHSKRSCCVPNCHKTYNKNDISLHKLPKEKLRLRKWMKYLKIRRNLSDSAVVCSDHFDASQFKLSVNEFGKYRRLRVNALPLVMKAIVRKKSKSARRRDKRMRQKEQPTVNIVEISKITNEEQLDFEAQPDMQTDFQHVEKKPVKRFVKKPYKCTVCFATFSNLTWAEEHLKKKHSTISAVQVNKTGIDIEDFAQTEDEARPDHLLQALVDRLQNYKWCSCRVCLLHYKMFLEHIKTSHASGNKVKEEEKEDLNPSITSTKVTTTEIPASSYPESTEVAIEDPNFDYFGAFIDEDVDLSSEEEPIDSNDLKQKVGNNADEDLSHYQSTVENSDLSMDLKLEHSIDEIMDSTQSGSLDAQLTGQPSTAAASTLKKLFFKVERVGDEKFYKCSTCQKRLTYAEIIGHAKEHTGPSTPHQSEEPKKQRLQTRVVKKLTQPMPPSLAVGITEFQCALCEAVYPERPSVYICLKNHAQDGWVSTIGGDSGHQSFVDDGSTNTEPNTTTIASNEMETAGEVEISQFEHPPNEDGQFGLEQTLEQIASDFTHEHASESTHSEFPLKASAGSSFKCDKCDWNGIDIEEHIQMVHGKKYKVIRAEDAKVRYVVQCRKCKDAHNQNLKFATLQEGVAHRRLKHSKIIDYNSVKYLTRIVVQTDRSEQKVTENFYSFDKNCLLQGYQCVCKMTYDFSNAAERCLAKHLGQKNFKCLRETVVGRQCGFLFYTQGDLDEHVKRVHDRTTMKTTVCEVCGATVSKTYIVKHLSNHKTESKNASDSSPVQCNLCFKYYAGEYRLWKHIQIIHKRKKNHECQVCGERFVHRSDAALCEAKHTGVKNMICHMCKMKFYTKSDKAKHNWKYHSKRRQTMPEEM